MSMVITIYNKRTKYFLVILFVLLSLMAWFDVSSSGQAGLKNANRGMAHIFIALVVVLHGIYIFFHNYNSKNSFSIKLLLLSIIIWFVLVDLINLVTLGEAGALLLLAIWWFLTYQFTYSFCRRNQGHIKGLMKVYMGMFVVWALLNVYARQQIMINFGQANAVTGYAYYLLIFVPFILLLKKSKIKTGLLILSIIMIMTSFKRGTMVTLPVMLIVYGYVKGLLANDLSKFYKYFGILLFLAILLIPIIDESSGGFLSQRFSQEQLEDGSGRSGNWELAINNIEQRSEFELFVGLGHGSSVKLLGTGVHNEWLEFLFSFGIIGFLLYLVLGLKFMRQAYTAFKLRSKYAPHICMMMVYFYMISIFSGFIGVYVTYYFFAFMGIVTYLIEEDINQRKLELV